ncbi:MAG: PhoP regulatory network YrbL family protein [Helicobacteraceae bacterium]|jgi:hypothetical protein|nr:PhoP regulatory network YrbL family protein [Helicobacteraceae bacterium]
MEFIGAGANRECFVHPNDPAKVIKITKSTSVIEQDAVESAYYKLLEKRRVPFDHVVRFYGEETVLDSDGKERRGFVFERALNSDGTPAIMLGKAIEENLLPFETIYRMLEDLHRKYLLKYGIILSDYIYENLFIKRDSDGAYRLLIIDGLGTIRSSWKFYLRLRFVILAWEVQIRRWQTVRRDLQRRYYRQGRFAFLSRFNWWWQRQFCLAPRSSS